MSGVNTALSAAGIWDMGKQAEDNQGCSKGFKKYKGSYNSQVFCKYTGLI